MTNSPSRSSCHPTLITGFFLTAFLVLFLPGMSRASSGPDIRVLISPSEALALLRGADLTVAVKTDGRFREVVDRVRGSSFSYRQGRIHLEGSDVSARVFAVSSKDGLVEYGGRVRRGRIILTALAGGMAVVNVLPLESYLIGLVNGEISSQWAMEAVMAQVIAARTFALYRMGQNDEVYDVSADVADQVYLGPGAEDDRAARAVRKTRGKALYYGDELVPAFYHSSCGGRTAGAEEVWGRPHPALVSVLCGDCAEAPNAQWDLILSGGEIQRVLNGLYPDAGAVRSLGIHRRTASGRVATLFFLTGRTRVLVDGRDFRSEVGNTRLKSTLYTISGVDGGVRFSGRGYGHGVGMCQWGAKGAAERGLDHEQILGRYYRGAEIRRVY